MEETHNESLIDLGAEEGTWFPFKGAAELKVRRIGGAKRRALFRQHIGKKTSDVQNFDKATEYQIALGCYALVDSKKVEIPARYLDGTPLAGQAGNVVLDGLWSPEVRRAVLGELPAVVKFVVAKADSLDAEADEEEAGKV